MELVRFMSAAEVRKYLAGETIRNETDWRGSGFRTGSKGICFFPADPPPEERLHYVSGIVSFEMVAVFETVGPVQLRESEGEYRDLEAEAGMDWRELLARTLAGDVQRRKVRELSMQEYNSAMLHMKHLGTVEMDETGEWKIRWYGNQDGAAKRKRRAGGEG